MRIRITALIAVTVLTVAALSGCSDADEGAMRTTIASTVSVPGPPPRVYPTGSETINVEPNGRFAIDLPGRGWALALRGDDRMLLEQRVMRPQGERWVFRVTTRGSVNMTFRRTGVAPERFLVTIADS